MARFWVEFINRGVVEQASTIDAMTPIKAAIKVAGGETFRRKQSRWIEITPVGATKAYEFVKAGKAKSPSPEGASDGLSGV